ncbi:hypothetical protein [Antarcticimicrobium luteum]|uniref:Uncharacterized protein n=1 Tax=Antarcticimicrobium luteum TaxID=2547397 RepID=A0A4R5UQM6_9RHOB|nr:hypothetical protein [Antarcticimicrobium luteum]TDK41225.1 hypothetical protein E1832_21280 [Antarcticimicrobium luteum]
MTGDGDGERSERKAPAVFLERQTYRRRRLMDAARLLPVLGALLFAVPLLWPGAEDAGTAAPVPTSRAIRYIFVVWALLILGNVWFGLLTRGWSGQGQGRNDDEAEPPQRERG